MLRFVGCVGALFVFALPIGAQGNTTDLVKRALVSAGPHEKLARLAKRKMVSKGTFYDRNGNRASFTNESWMDLSRRQSHGVLTIVARGKSERRVRAVNGDEGWEKVENTSMALSEYSIKALQQMQHECYLKLLYPLVEDKNLTLTYLGQASKVGSEEAWSLKVSAKGKDDVTLFFEKKSARLIKLSSLMADEPPSKAKILCEQYFSDFREFGGVIYPTRRTLYCDGKKTTEDQLQLIEPIECIDPVWLKKP